MRRLVQRSLALPLVTSTRRKAKSRTLRRGSHVRVLPHRFADPALVLPERGRALAELRRTLHARRPETQEVCARKEHVGGMRGVLQRVPERRGCGRSGEEVQC